MFLLAFLCTIFYFSILKDLPSVTSLTSNRLRLTTHIRDRNGIELYKIYSDQNRTILKLSEIPTVVRQATIAIEDKNFYSHHGFSISGTFRAFLKNTVSLFKNSCQDSVSCNITLEGGSTITQQLVKTGLLTPEKTFQRKIKELLLSLAVETKYTKDQILEMYLNRVSYGSSAYGIEEAAQTYFGKSANRLDLAEAALLAGLPAAPTTYSPYGNHPDLAKSRQKEVLRLMAESRFITWETAAQAAQKDLVFKPPSADVKAPHFVMYVKELLEQKYGSQAVEQGGLDVTTSLDLDIQQRAEQVVKQETAKIAYLHITNGAALITKPSTGEILAMVGSRDYFDIANDGNVNVTLSLRQPGSSIKPLNYALSLSRGLTPASLIEDSPVTFTIPGQPPYSPTNYDHRYHGRVSLRTALGSSYNIPAVKLLAQNGIPDFINLAQKMGISTWTDPSRFGLSLTLGGGEIKMVDLATAYGVFANSGTRIDLQPIISVHDSQGHLLEQPICNDNSTSKNPSSCPKAVVLDPQIAFLINDILSDNNARSPTFGPHSDLYFPTHQVAVKTGTTNSLRDNWTIGYTPDILVAVWVGNNDNSPMSYVASGITGASPIWKNLISPLLESSPAVVFNQPPGMVRFAVCPLTGERSCTNCSGNPEYFVEGTQPKTSCDPISIAQIQAKSLKISN